MAWAQGAGVSGQARAKLRLYAAVALLAAPWLWPFALGPWPAALPWLVSLTCTCIFLLLACWPQSDLGRVAAAAWLLAALVSSVIGLLQYFGISAWFAPWVNVTAAGEAFANLRQRNQFASLTNLGLVVLLWGPWGRTPTLDPSVNGRPPGAVLAAFAPHFAAVLLSFGNAASLSRTGLLQLLLLLPLALVWNGRHDRRVWGLLAAALAGYAAATFMLPLLAGFDPMADGLASRFAAGSQPCGSRLVLWDNVLYLIAHKPLFGWGWGELDYAHFITLYPGQRFCEILDNAHNLPLHLAVELGVPVAVLFCALGLWFVWRHKPWSATSAVHRTAWAALAIILLHSMLEYPLWYGPFQMAAGLSLWLLLRAKRAPASGREELLRPWHNALRGLPMPAARRATAAAAMVLLCCVAYAAWDYYRIGQIYLAPGARASAYRENTLEKIRPSWLFRKQVMFAEFTLTELSRDNAAYLNAMAHELLHFSPEARVVEKLIESALLLGRDAEALAYLARYRAAFPKEYALWAKANKPGPALPASAN